MIKRLSLNTLQNTRKSYARVIRAFLAGDITIKQGRTLGYMLTGMLGYGRLEADLSIEARLEEIENELLRQKEEKSKGGRLV